MTETGDSSLLRFSNFKVHLSAITINSTQAPLFPSSIILFLPISSRSSLHLCFPIYPLLLSLSYFLFTVLSLHPTDIETPAKVIVSEGEAYQFDRISRKKRSRDAIGQQKECGSMMILGKVGRRQQQSEI